MGDSNAKSNYDIIGTAAGLSPAELDGLKRVYEAAASVLGKYIQISSCLAGPAGQLVSLAFGLGELFGSSNSAPSQFDILYGQIKGLIEQVEKKIDAVSRQIEGIALSDIESHAEAIQTTARAYAAQLTKPGGAVNTPQAGAFSTALFDSATILNKMYKDVYWQRTFDPTQVCTVAGSDALRYQPPHEADPNLVWDYRAALPVLTKVIDARLLCLQLTAQPLGADAQQEIDTMADFVTGVHNRIQAGFTPTEVPGTADRHVSKVSGPDWQHSFAAVDLWYMVGQKSGAVDTYAGRGVTETFPLPQIDQNTGHPMGVPAPWSSGIGSSSMPVQSWTAAANQGPPEQRMPFNLLYLTRALRLRAVLDDLAGLPGLRMYIGNLRQLSGGAYAKLPPPVALPFGPRELATPPDYLVKQLAHPLDSSSKEVLQFSTGWPTSVRALTAYFASQFGGDGTSVRSMVAGN